MMKYSQNDNYSPAPAMGYIPVLDGLRAVSILLVIVAHYGLKQFVPGGFGVTVFFFISGFIISRQMTFSFVREGKMDFLSFYVRRVLRLMPAALTMIALSGAVFVALGGNVSVAEVLTAVFYGANYYDLYVMYDSHVPDVRHPFLILWSLAVEEHFYIVFPVFFSLLFVRSRAYVAALVGLIIVALLWRLYVWHGCHPDQGNHFLCAVRTENRLYKATDTRFDALLYGVLLTALLAENAFSAIAKQLMSVRAFVVGLVVLASTFVIRDEAFRETYRYSLQGLGLMPVVVSVLFSPSLRLVRVILSSRVMVMIGRLSYSLYLYHWVGLMLGDALIHTPYHIWEYPVALVATVVLSIASYYGVERPMVRLRKRFGSHAVADERISAGAL